MECGLNLNGSVPAWIHILGRSVLKTIEILIFKLLNMQTNYEKQIFEILQS